MNKKTSLIITSIAPPNKVLQTYAAKCEKHGVEFVVIGDTKSPKDFSLPGCDFWSISRQKELDFRLSKIIPEKHYARKNIGYLLAARNGAEVIIETDDDNLPQNGFWDERKLNRRAHLVVNQGWVNVLKYFSKRNIWPRGFPLEHLLDELPALESGALVDDVLCPIQQGLADENPDVDAIYRLIMPLPVRFKTSNNVALGKSAWCPFNSQNTTWFKVAFPLLYLPSYCNFRMTDIWRSFVAQRIAWSCGWSVLFHNATVHQERNMHNLLQDFEDEIPGYLNNSKICRELGELNLKKGPAKIFDNLVLCYSMLVEKEYMDTKELELLERWIEDLVSLDIY
jgi:hypothetical protein